MTDNSHHELRRRFRDLLNGNVCHKAASVFDPISVRMAADVGFSVGILGGSVVSLQVLGAPDLSLITLHEYAEQASRVGRASQIPVIADADHGYGNALNVMRTVTELQKAGLAALTLEDTLLPRQYGEHSNLLITLEEATTKIYAARFARSDDALCIIARTNVAATTLEDSIARTAAYEKAGADAICLVGVGDLIHLKDLTSHLTLPLMLISYGNPALSNLERLGEFNVRVLVDGHQPYMAALKATYDSLYSESSGEAEKVLELELLAKYTLLESYNEWVNAFLQPSSSLNDQTKKL